jgi:energy-coupling factor transporter ATP-binding protein EcfA2
MVLDIEQLSIASHKITALQGANGAGKSTLLKLLSFIEMPQQGLIIFSGKPYAKSSLQTLRKQVVLVAQKPYFLRGTVFDNVMLGLKFRSIPPRSAKKQVIESLEQVGLSQFFNRPVADLSGGEAQKVALARAITLQPEVLLLDEPFSHLDQSSIQSLRQIIADYSLGDERTVIFSTHDGSHAENLAAEVIHLNSGKIKN